ncbi:hypothetical protein [Flavobacterium sp. N502536]|uniref:hypothetical protein n=1 Tax=Flavobacterium sp. N502536 TaxID=2986837 RepID=UPI002222AE5D|nr:hypothetical protein [Flavobacterium sp. N502536]
MTKIKSFISLFFKTLFFLILIFTIVYTSINRNLQTIIQNILFFGGVINGIFIFSLISIYFQDRKTNFQYVNILIAFFSAFLLGLTFYSVSIVLEDFTSLQKNYYFSSYHNWKTPLIVFIILSIGFSLFYFRLYVRSIYGLTEAVIGVIIGVSKILEKENKTVETEFYFAILTASIYLIVRGLDNIHQGLTKEPLDPVAQRLKKMIK